MVTDNISKKAHKTDSFESLIQPYSFEEFSDKYWEKETLVIAREDKTFYKDILTLDQVDHIIDLHQPSEHNFRVTTAKDRLSPMQYLNNEGRIKLNKLYAYYANGYSIVLRRIDQLWNPIKKLCFNMRHSMSHHVKANMYLTPKNSVAYPAHIDAHDVIVLQIEGQKIWKLYDPLPQIQTPLLESPLPMLDNYPLSNPKEITLNAGDFMYLPRGIPHDAYTTDQSSLHLTIGVFPVQWMDLINQTVSLHAHSNVALRKALPLGYLNQMQSENFKENMKANFDQILDALKEELNFSSSLPIFHNHFRNSQIPVGDGHFSSIDHIDQLRLNTKVKKREDVRCAVSTEGNNCRIIFDGNTTKAPISFLPAFQYIQNAEDAFEIDVLPLQSEESKLKLVAQLIKGGLLRLL